jgi:hypothetical protein
LTKQEIEKLPAIPIQRKGTKKMDQGEQNNPDKRGE